MTVPIQSLYIFNRSCECIYFRDWRRRAPGPESDHADGGAVAATPADAADSTAATMPLLTGADTETAKLVYGVVFSLRNMVTKMAREGSSAQFLGYTTSTYALHHFASPTGLRIVALTDVDANKSAVREALWRVHSAYVDCVVKNPVGEFDAQVKGVRGFGGASVGPGGPGSNSSLGVRNRQFMERVELAVK